MRRGGVPPTNGARDVALRSGGVLPPDAEREMRLEGSCQCGAVRFSVTAYAPVPYLRCYCSVCRKTAGGGGFAVNLGAKADTLRVAGE